ncbi:Tfp pilus assembly protein ATPase PilU [Pseudomonas aeruginosa]|nr:hypothetical protein [Pseudomonas aeruginosa]VEE74872.1 Tfp pilus assembly protein ATPase PilU [Pseudomonas aeruginosa]
MSVNPIIQAQFVDLYLGEGFADVKAWPAPARAESKCPRVGPHAQELLQICRQTLEELQDPEFAIVVDGVLLRVTQLEDAFNGGSVFVLRRSTAQVRSFEDIGYPSEVVSALMAPQLQGLILFCGDMATGKTSSAASLILARLQTLGGVASPSKIRRKPISAASMA